MNDDIGARFQLIRKPRKVLPSEDQFTEPASQGVLFPMPKRRLVIFLVFPYVTEEDFTRTLELAKPVAILELRRFPRFDMGQLDRQQAFRWFEAIHSKYYDLSPISVSGDQYVFDPVHLVGAFLRRNNEQIAGPVMILISRNNREPDSADGNVFDDIARLFTTASNQPWETLEIPQFA
ncbi:MAG TPA: hypothetical protein VHY84_08260 [Bryobacteraceae bacterium]|jgi:hypothetical protein|nr:hypothetical protein [Bryobacteraceae bacterium]